MRLTAPFLLAAAANLHAATGARTEPPTLNNASDGAYRYGTPNYIDDSDFDSALQKPNATGSVSFVGRNVSAAYPSGDVDGWTLSINVTSDIIKPGSDHRQITGSAISIKQAAGLSTSSSNNGTDGFQVCVNIMRINPNATANYTQLASGDGGTCGSYLSQECRDDLHRLAGDRFAANGTCTYSNDPPASCGNVTFMPARTSITSPSVEPAFILPASFYQHGWTAFTYGSDPPVASSNQELVLEDYDKMAKIVYPVLLTWGYTNTSTSANGTDPGASLACISATDFTEGSRVPASDAQSDGGTNAVGRVDMSMGLIKAAVAVAALVVVM